MKKTVTVNLIPPYPVHIGESLLVADYVYDFLRRITNNWVLISDTNLANLHSKAVIKCMKQHQLNCYPIYFPAGEINKTRETKLTIENQMLRKKHGRDVAVIAIGGGIATDMGGFVAATYNRGIPVVYFPTSLLAMVDASIGGKTAVNTEYGKNLIGAFYQPKAVFIDVSTLNTLPLGEYKLALVEVLVHSLIYDCSLFDFLNNNLDEILEKKQDLIAEIIYRNCVIKAAVVEQDEKENELRKILNFGHTIGHAIELCSDYKMPHGEAVAIGIVVESFISNLVGELRGDVFCRIKNFVDRLGLSLKIAPTTKVLDIVNAMKMDKKSVNNIPHFIMLNDIGNPVTYEGKYAFPISDDILQKALTYLLDTFR